MKDEEFMNPVTGSTYVIRKRGSKGIRKGLKGKWKKDVTP